MIYSEMMIGKLRKFKKTLSIAITLIFARTFGEYIVSHYADGVNYAEYEWRGQRWAFPTEPINYEH